MNYYIKQGYVSRPGAVQDAERESRITDDWQDSVYGTAAHLAHQLHYRSILDIGCGSGFKLVKWFDPERYSTIGVDLTPAVEILWRRYPNHLWAACDMDFTRAFDNIARIPFGYHDLVICSDVIEHLNDPDKLLGVIAEIKPQHVVLSTSDRDLLPLAFQNGPPQNPTHVREWSFAEFGQYIEGHLTVEQHFHSNKKQATQCIVGRVK